MKNAHEAQYKRGHRPGIAHQSKLLSAIGIEINFLKPIASHPSRKVGIAHHWSLDIVSSFGSGAA